MGANIGLNGHPDVSEALVSIYSFASANRTTEALDFFNAINGSFFPPVTL